MINPLSTIHPNYLLYFFYGATFVFIGLSISAKNLKASNLRIAQSIWLLAAFGYMQGMQEWMDIHLLLEVMHMTLKEIYGIKIISLVLSTASFLCLLQFGLSLIHADTRNRRKWATGLYTAFSVLLLVFLMLLDYSSTMQSLKQTEFFTVNSVGIIGSLTAAYGMDHYAREIKYVNNAASRNFSFAGMSFAFFAFFESFVFSRIAGFFMVPTEPVRVGMMVLTAYFILKALNLFDVETRKRVEEQARQLVQSEKLASLGKLATGIAHEINNPLNNASLGLQLIKSNLGKETELAIRSRIDAVEKSLDRAAVIAQELLQYSRSDEPDLQPLNINEVITESLKHMKEALQPVEVRLDLAPVPDINGNHGKLEQVFVNVISNAGEAMPGGGRLSITSALADGMVEVHITDTGTGITEENLQRVFEPFFTTKEVGEGTGLGLYISYGIIRQHRGDMKITSLPGQGATVIITIPAVNSGG